LNITDFPPTVRVYVVFSARLTVAVPAAVIVGAADKLVAVVAVSALPFNVTFPFESAYTIHFVCLRE
jgi:predicted aconitase with swiveling domain